MNPLQPTPSDAGNLLHQTIGLLRCPATGLSLSLVDLDEAEQRCGGPLVALRTNGTEKAEPVGPTPQVLLREDKVRAYPFSQDAPVLLTPEVLGLAQDRMEFDLTQATFEEAYLEMDFYNKIGFEEALDFKQSEGFLILNELVGQANGELDGFPKPAALWIDSVFDGPAQTDAYSALAPLAGKRIAQIGGKGTHAVKFLLGGAEAALVITPMLGEAACAYAMAAEFGVADRLIVVIGLAEQLPLVDNCVDGIYVTGSVHHMQSDLAMPEMYRVLSPGGVFTAIEPFKAPFYAIGTKVFGKREANAHCSPMTDERLEPFHATFVDAQLGRHGVFFRYPLLAMWKLKLGLPVAIVRRFDAADEKLTNWVPFLKKAGSSISMAGRKPLVGPSSS